jgi:glycosyltransferase involved in cell wall biosynthesis
MRHFGPRADAVVQHERFRGILGRKASRRLFSLLDEADGFRIKLPLGALRHLGGMRGAAGGRFYLNIGHTGLDSPGFRQWVIRSQARPIYFVHDLIPITHPEFCRAGEAERHRERMRAVLTTAAGVIGNSQATLDELSAFAAAENLPRPPMMAAWLGVDPLPPPAKIRGAERPTFVIVGTIEGRKNHRMLLRIWSRLVDRLGTDAPRLLIIGQRGWEADEVFETLETDDALRGHVIELNGCSDKELARHLHSARALLFPSLIEGYGLPLVEALGAGVPVIASSLPVFQEIAGAMPDYLEARDEGAWEAAILDYAQPTSAARTAQLERMKGFRAARWDEHFNAVEKWLATLG